MGWLEFGASVIGDLAWPIVALITLGVLHKPIKRLIGRVKNAKGGGAEVEFELEQVEDSTDAAIEGIASSPRVETTASAEVGLGGSIISATLSPEQLAQALSASAAASVAQGARVNRDPSGAVLEAWTRVLALLIDMNVATRGPGRPTRNPRLILAQLKNAGAASDAFLEAAEGLFNLRNEVAHGETVPTTGFARTYVERANQIESVGRSLLAGKPEPDTTY